MTFGSLMDTHLKGNSQCRTAYEAAENEKKKGNSARLFRRALTTEPPNKPDGASSASGSEAHGLRSGIVFQRIRKREATSFGVCSELCDGGRGSYM